MHRLLAPGISRGQFVGDRELSSFRDQEPFGWGEDFSASEAAKTFHSEEPLKSRMVGLVL